MIGPRNDHCKPEDPLAHASLTIPRPRQAYIQPDEILEVTPKQVRMRKRELDKNKRHTKRRDGGKTK